MNTETDSLVSNSKNRDGLARIFEHIADRLDEIVAERRRASTERRKVDDGGTDGR